MKVSFVNKYTVTREAYKRFHHLDPGAILQPQVQNAERAVPDRARTAGSIVRIAGLCIAIGIIFVAVMARMTVFILVGIVLAGMYAMRIIQARNRREQKENRPRPPQSLQPPFGQQPQMIDERAKWTRYIRFGDSEIEVVDPDEMQDYTYSQITKITDDPAYMTLWMNNDKQVRVSKRGFTVGTLQGFEQFIMSKTHRMIGSGAKDEKGDPT